MRFFRDVQLGIKSLLLHKLRSMLTMLGVVFGVGCVVAMLSIGEGASRSALERFRLLGTNNIILTSVKPAAEETAAGAGGSQWVSIYGLKYDHVLRLSEQFPTIDHVVPARHVPQDSRLGARQIELRVVGTTPDWFKLVERDMIAGRPLTWEDMEEHAGVCVLTTHGAERLLATEHVIGQSLIIGGRAFVVVGIVEPAAATGATFELPDTRADAYIPLTTCRERFGEMIIRRSAGTQIRDLVELHQIIVQVNDIEQVRATADAIEFMLQHFHDKQDYDISVPLALLEEERQQRRIWTFTLGSVAAISLIVGGIGIMNIMLATVTERTREIGIRRAIGARKRQIISQFMIETVVLSGVGGIVGVGIGPLLALSITFFSDIPTIVPMYALVLSLGISMIVGILSGLYPAIRAANLDPIVALRHE